MTWAILYGFRYNGQFQCVSLYFHNEYEAPIANTSFAKEMISKLFECYTEEEIKEILTNGAEFGVGTPLIKEAIRYPTDHEDILNTIVAKHNTQWPDHPISPGQVSIPYFQSVFTDWRYPVKFGSNNSELKKYYVNPENFQYRHDKMYLIDLDNMAFVTIQHFSESTNSRFPWIEEVPNMVIEDLYNYLPKQNRV